MKKLIYIAFACFGTISAWAQQEAMYTHYMYNTLAVNPGYAGSRGALTMTALGRFQWVGFEGAPMTQTFTAHTPVATESLGLGLSLVNDKIGPTTATSFAIDVAYRMKISEKSRLCFGLKGGFDNYSAGLENVRTQQQNDASFQENIRNRMLPNVGFGIYYQAPRFYIGASVPKIVENGFYANSANTTVNIGSESRHYYLIAGAVFDLSPSLQLKPVTLLKAVNGSPLQVDLTANFVIRETVTLGAMYRSSDAFGILAGVNITEQFMIGYSFDWSTGNTTGRYNAGSHEVMLRYDLVFSKQKRIKSPRYF